MSLDSDSIKALAADLKQYVVKHIELKTIELQQKGSIIAAAIFSNVLGIMLLLVGLFFLLVAAGIGLGYLFDNMMLGFGALAFLLILIGTYFYKTKRNVLRKKLQKAIGNFIDSALNQDEENQDSTEKKSTTSQ